MTAEYGIPEVIPLTRTEPTLRSITPAELLAGTYTDYDPVDAVSGAGFHDAQNIRQAVVIAGATIAGLDAELIEDGQYVIIENLGPGALTLAHDAGTAANRLVLPDDTDIEIGAQTSVMLIRDLDAERWRLGPSGGAGTGASGDAFSLTNNEATTVVAGTPVYVDAAGGFKRAQADDETTGRTIGIAQADIAAGASGRIQLSGAIDLETDEWDAICGTTGGLTFNTPYYVSAATAGKLTATPPSAVDEVVQQVIVALSPTQAVVRVAEPVVIGSGANLIRLTNNNASPMIIGTPVYSDAAEGMDLAIADGSGKSVIVGLVADASIASGARGYVAVGGLMVATTTQWDAICGTSGGLTFNRTYYLHKSAAGQLQYPAPSSPTDDGKEVVVAITALSTTEARIAITSPILL